MTPGAIQIENKEGIHSVRVEIIDDNNNTVGFAQLSINKPVKGLMEKFEKVIGEILK